MTDAPAAQRDPRKVRLGLAIICGVVVIALGLTVVVEAPAARLGLVGIAGWAFIRAFLLYRWLRAQGRSTP